MGQLPPFHLEPSPLKCVGGDEIVAEAASTADEVVPEAASTADELVAEAVSTADETLAKAESAFTAVEGQHYFLCRD